MTRKLTTLALTVSLVIGSLAPVADAGHAHRRARAHHRESVRATRHGGYRYQMHQQAYVPAPVSGCANGVCPAPVKVQPQAGLDGDPADFLAWFNGMRAQRGLQLVGYDQNLANEAAVNNSWQSQKGLGHYAMGSARRQNAALKLGSSIRTMWMNSPGHRAAMLDPSITAIGLAGSGNGYYTLNLK